MPGTRLSLDHALYTLPIITLVLNYKCNFLLHKLFAPVKCDL